MKMTRARAAETTKAASKKASALPDLQDEEVAGFAAAGGATKDDKESAGGSDAEPLRWQVTTFAMSCLNDIYILIGKDIITNGESPAQAALQSKMADVVRMAYSNEMV